MKSSGVSVASRDPCRLSWQVRCLTGMDTAAQLRIRIKDARHFGATAGYNALLDELARIEPGPYETPDGRRLPEGFDFIEYVTVHAPCLEHADPPHVCDPNLSTVEYIVVPAEELLVGVDD